MWEGITDSKMDWKIPETLTTLPAAFKVNVNNNALLLATIPGSKPKANGVCSRLGHILHPSFVWIIPVVFHVILLTNQQTNGPADMGKNITSLADLVKPQTCWHLDVSVFYAVHFKTLFICCWQTSFCREGNHCSHLEQPQMSSN